MVSEKVERSAASRWQVRLLGCVEVTDGAERLVLAPRDAAVLAQLVLARPGVVSVDALIDALWGDDPPASAGNAVQGYVSRLRRALGPDSVRRSAGGYVLDLPSSSVDVEQFERAASGAAHAARDDDWERASDLLAAATSLWRAPPFGPELADSEWAAAHVARLQNVYLGVLELRAEAEVELGRGPEVVALLEEQVGQFPFSERLHAARVRALYAAGRRADALDAYEHARATLADELGLDPGPALRAVHQAALEDRLDQATVSTVPSPVRLQAPPAPVNRIIGRERDVAELFALLRGGDVRLVTLLGPGGVGKTRLAVELADRAAGMYQDGVCWVPLAGLHDPDQVVPALANALSVSAGPVPLDEAVAATLSRRHVLLVVDNLEHVRSAAPVLGRLLAAAPRVQILITSRVASRLAGEHRVIVRPLRSPASIADPLTATADAPEMAAVTLFLERARAVQPLLARRDQDELAAVAEICRRLDGLPLAIELAAARCDLLAPRALLARLGARLSLLTTGTADADDRHASLGATLDWSIGLLAEPARRLLYRLSVFHGGFTLDGAEAVGDHDGALGTPVLDILQQLSDASLVTQALGGREGIEPRLMMLQTVREYSAERLDEAGEAERTRNAHAAYLAQQLRSSWRGLPLYPRDSAHASWLEGYGDDLDAALTWTHEQGDGATLTELALQLAALRDFTAQAEHALRWLAIAAEGAQTTARRADVEIWRSMLAEHNADQRAAVTFGRRAVALADQTCDIDRQVLARGSLACKLSSLGDLDEAARLGQAMLDFDLDKVSDADARALACTIVVLAFASADAELSLRLGYRAVEYASAAGGAIQSIAANNLADALLTAGDARGARHWARVALAADVWTGRNAMLAYPLDNLGVAELTLGNPEAAQQPLVESLQLVDWAGDESSTAYFLASHAAQAAARGHYRRATVLYAGHLAHMARLRTVAQPSCERLVERYLADLPTLVEDNTALLTDIGAKLSLAELVQIAVGAPSKAPLDLDLPVGWEVGVQLHNNRADA
jgi:predicted ATPase/DNA-binding SARP family transcriptional activator